MDRWREAVDEWIEGWMDGCMEGRMDGWIRCVVGRDPWIDRWILKFALACLETLTIGVFPAKEHTRSHINPPSDFQILFLNDEHYASNLLFLLYFLPLCLFKKIKPHLSKLSVRKMDRWRNVPCFCLEAQAKAILVT